MPLFVYGSLKPSEIAYKQFSTRIERFEEASLKGFQLYIRDLMPVVSRSNNADKVDGFLLYPKKDEGDFFYKQVMEFEGENYQLESIQVIKDELTEINANVFVEKSDLFGRKEPLNRPWSSLTDPLLSRSFPALMVDIDRTFPSFADQFSESYSDWHSKNIRIGYYLVLVSILEHIWSLTFGNTSESGPNTSKQKMARSDEFKKAFRNAQREGLIPYLSVNAYKYLGSEPFETRSPKGALNAWTTVRNNLLHRGKSGRDTELVENAAIGLANTLYFYLIDQIPNILETWKVSEPQISFINKN